MLNSQRYAFGYLHTTPDKTLPPLALVNLLPAVWATRRTVLIFHTLPDGSGFIQQPLEPRLTVAQCLQPIIEQQHGFADAIRAEFRQTRAEYTAIGVIFQGLYLSQPHRHDYHEGLAGNANTLAIHHHGNTVLHRWHPEHGHQPTGDCRIYDDTLTALQQAHHAITGALTPDKEATR